jgi:PAS domain S-box-containing protein
MSTRSRGRRFPISRLRGLAACFGVLAALAAGQSAAAAPPDAPKLVVVFYPNESDRAPGLILADHAIRSTFSAEAPWRVEVRNEYVDASRLRDPDFKQAQVSFLRQKYAGRKVDLVMAGLSSGLDFVLDHREQLFPGVPVVYIAVDQREVKSRRLPADVAGVPIRMDLAGTLDIALRLHPGSRRVYVVCGCAPFDADWEGEARRAFGPYEGRLEFVYLSGLPMAELLDQVATLPEGSLVYYLHIFRDGAGATLVPAEALERLAERASAPIYGHVGTYVGRGIVGGRVFDFELEGRNAARLGARLLKGEGPGALENAEVGTNSDVFDWHQIKRWGIDESRLPGGSTVRNREPSLWEGYKWHVAAAAAFCLVQAALIAGLVAQLAKRRRGEAALRESEGRFRLMADAAPVLIWASGTDKKCTYCNRPWLEFTGRPLEGELGDGWAGGVHPDDRKRCLEVYATHFDAREPFEMVYRLRRHDGEYRWILDRGVPRFAPGGEFVGYLGACTDITERRQAEDKVRASRSELQLLTRKLLEAQEAERRRIARELHDDVNQGLALVAVEVELLARSCREAPPRAAEHVAGLSARLRELSSSVHNLSHQLHPSKLEHLGLVAAVNGLCRELRQGHGLEVAFAHSLEPGLPPQDVALCLYRIVQEALRNVIRHSGSRRASVELTELAGAIRLRVSDDGCGFDPGAASGLGLVSMRERLHLVGGDITIDSRPSGGTRISVRVPLAAPAATVAVTPLHPTADAFAADSPTEKVP